jgi:hypothetical protein
LDIGLKPNGVKLILLLKYEYFNSTLEMDDELTSILSKNTASIVIGYLTDLPVLPYIREINDYGSFYWNFIRECIVKDRKSDIRFDDVHREFRAWFRNCEVGDRIPYRQTIRDELEYRLGNLKNDRWLGYKINTAVY